MKAGDVAQAATTPLSVVVLLTDGESTVGESEPTLILQAVRAANKHSSKKKCLMIIASFLHFFCCDDYYSRQISAS